MINTLIYINDALMDVDSNTIVASTFKAIDIGDLKSRNTNYTNRFKLPKTESNIINTGFTNELKSKTKIPYRILPARINQNGIDTIKDGIAVIVNTSTSIEVDIYSGAFDFFNNVGDKSIRDLNMNAYDSYSGNANAILKNPFIDYGALDESSNPLDFTGNEYWSCPYKTLIEEIITQNGYEKTGDIFNNPKLALIYLPGLGYGGYNEAFTAPKTFQALVADSGAVVNLSGITNHKLPFTNVIDSSEFYNNTDTYIVQDPDGVLFGGTYFIFQAFGHIDFTISSLAGLGATVSIELFSNTTGVYQRLGLTNGTYSFDFEISDRIPGLGNISGIDGGQIFMRARMSNVGGSATLTLNSGSFSNKVLTDPQVLYTSVQGILPDIKQKDLFKDFAIRFGVLFSENNGTLICKTISEIIKDRFNAKDWTAKRDTSIVEKLTYEFRSYAQSNLFKYADADDTKDTSIGQGVMSIDNENLDTESTLYTSIFAGCRTLKMGNESSEYVTAARIPVLVVEEANLVHEVGSCRLATLVDRSLSGIVGLVDGRSIAIDDKILVKSQTTQSENGVYIVKSGSWIRASDADSSDDLSYALVYVESGNTLSDTYFLQTTANPSVGSSNIVFSTSSNNAEVIDRIVSEDQEPGLRLIMIRDKYSYEPTLSGSISSYEVGYFIDSLADYDMSFQGFIDNHYSELELSLQEIKLIERYYYLNEVDIASIDLLAMIYDSGDYFMINETSKYVPNSTTKVELLKVS